MSARAAWRTCRVPRALLFGAQPRRRAVAQAPCRRADSGRGTAPQPPSGTWCTASGQTGQHGSVAACVAAALERTKRRAGRRTADQASPSSWSASRAREDDVSPTRRDARAARRDRAAPYQCQNQHGAAGSSASARPRRAALLQDLRRPALRSRSSQRRSQDLGERIAAVCDAPLRGDSEDAQTARAAAEAPIVTPAGVRRRASRHDRIACGQHLVLQCAATMHRWFAYALAAWPRAEWLGKTEEDVYV